MSDPGRSLRGGYTQLARCYKQINASVGQFATDTLIADTAALASGSATNDRRFTRTQNASVPSAPSVTRSPPRSRRP